MERDELRAVQAPLKQRYAAEPEAALVTLAAEGSLGDGVSCSVNTGRAIAELSLIHISSPRDEASAAYIARKLADGASWAPGDRVLTRN